MADKKPNGIPPEHEGKYYDNVPGRPEMSKDILSEFDSTLPKEYHGEKSEPMKKMNQHMRHMKKKHRAK